MKTSSCLAEQMADDFMKFASSYEKVPTKISYLINDNPKDNDRDTNRFARLAMFEEIELSAFEKYEYKYANQKSSLNKFASDNDASNQGLRKEAFDTTKIDQGAYIPRRNLQYWNRSESFVSEDEDRKVKVFTRLAEPLAELKEVFASTPEWHDSYTKTLHDAILRICRLNDVDKDVFAPQLNYLEQLMFARYGLSMDEMEKIDTLAFKNRVLKKDESLLKRGAYLLATEDKNALKAESAILDKSWLKAESAVSVKTGLTPAPPAGIIPALFGSNVRKPGEKRTITITITDEDGDVNVDGAVDGAVDGE